MFQVIKNEPGKLKMAGRVGLEPTSYALTVRRLTSRPPASQDVDSDGGLGIILSGLNNG